MRRQYIVRSALFVVTAAVLLLAYAGQPKPPVGSEIGEPNAVATPVLSGAAKLWTIRNDSGLVPIAYYQRVTMPDGTTQELKSRTALTIEQWKALAQISWNSQKAAELSKPKPCTRCGGTGVEPQ